MRFETKPNSNAPTAMSDADRFAMFDACDDVFDEFNSALENWAFTQLHALKNIRASVENMTAENVAALVAANEGLDVIWDGDVKKFTSNLDENIAALESKIDEWLGDGILRALVGTKTSKLEYLDRALPECKNAINNLNDKKVEKRTSDTGWLWMFGRVKSRFLLSYNVFDTQADAFIKLCNAITSISSVDKVDPAAIMKTLVGTPYFKALEADTSKAAGTGGEIKADADKTDWIHTVIKGFSGTFSPLRWILGPITGMAGFGVAIYARFFHDPEQPIGKRGWDSKEKILHGIDKTLVMVDAAKKAIAKCQKLLIDKSADPDKVKFIGATAQFVTNSIGEMGRGMVYACKKLNTGRLGRMFGWNRVS